LMYENNTQAVKLWIDFYSLWIDFYSILLI
jgi:hypothetical protein